MIGREEKWRRVRKKLENNCFLSSPRLSVEKTGLPLI